MKKLNNKGMTLVELIVSFLIVSVAMLYFFQTLRTVQEIYRKANDKTQNFVDKDYALRVLDAYITSRGDSNLNDVCSNYSLECEIIEKNTINVNINSYTIKKDGNPWVTLYRYNGD